MKIDFSKIDITREPTEAFLSELDNILSKHTDQYADAEHYINERLQYLLDNKGGKTGKADNRLLEFAGRYFAEGRNSLVFTTAVMVCFEQCKYYIARRQNELYVNVAQDGENYIQEAYMVIMDLLPTYEANCDSFEAYARASIDGAFRSERSGHVKSEKTKYTTIILNDYKTAKEQFLKRGIQDPTIADIARQINLKGKTRKITERQITNALKQEKTVIGFGEVDAYTTSNAYNPEKEILMQDLKDQFAKMRTDIRLPRTAQLMIEVFAEEMTSDPELDNLTGNETIKKLMAKHGYEVSSQEAGMFLSIIQNILIKDGYHHEIKHRRNTRPRIRSTYELRTIQEKTELENDILASLLANA